MKVHLKHPQLYPAFAPATALSAGFDLRWPDRAAAGALNWSSMTAEDARQAAAVAKECNERGWK